MGNIYQWILIIENPILRVDLLKSDGSLLNNYLNQNFAIKLIIIVKYGSIK